MSEHIRIGPKVPRNQYIADGVLTSFDFTFPVMKETDLEVWLNDTRQEAGYNLSGLGQDDGGNVVFETAPPQGHVVTLRRWLEIARMSDFSEGGVLRAKTLNDELDRQTAALQQISHDLGNTVQRQVTAIAQGPLYLPEPEAGKVFRWKQDLSGFENSAYDPDVIATEAAQSAQSAEQDALLVQQTRDQVVVLEQQAQVSAQLAQSCAGVETRRLVVGVDIVSGATSFVLQGCSVPEKSFIKICKDGLHLHGSAYEIAVQGVDILVTLVDAISPHDQELECRWGVYQQSLPAQSVGAQQVQDGVLGPEKLAESYARLNPDGSLITQGAAVFKHSVDVQSAVAARLRLNNSAGQPWQFSSFTDGSLYLGCNGVADYLKIDAGGNLIAPSLTLGNGLNYAAAKTLDDYETGTFLPVVTFGGANAGLTYITQEGWYIKIGDFVSCCLRVRMGNKGTSTGVARVENLPFVSKQSFGARGGAVLPYWMGINGTPVSPAFLVEDAANTGDFYCGGRRLTEADFVDGADFAATVQYQVF